MNHTNSQINCGFREQRCDLLVLSWGTCVLRSFGVQMAKLLANECQKRAAECAEMAEQQDDPERRREYSELATIWRVIAKESEETEVVENSREIRGGRGRAPFLFCV
jgi:hypothetical protein